MYIRAPLGGLVVIFINDVTWIGGHSKQQLSVPQRLLCGAIAGATATTVTHPLDVIRLRLSIDRELKGIVYCSHHCMQYCNSNACATAYQSIGSADAFSSLMREGGVRTLFKGYAPTLLSVSPFIAINFATFDFLKSNFMPVLAPFATYPLNGVA
jgi:solute carrier family 25 phosphate transporter 23/24/25/41